MYIHTHASQPKVKRKAGKLDAFSLTKIQVVGFMNKLSN